MFSIEELFFILEWWAVFFVIGIIFIPVTSIFFEKFIDRGFIFSKVLGTAIVSYVTLVVNIFHILPFGLISIMSILWLCLLFNLWVLKKKNVLSNTLSKWKIFVFEEVLFLIGIFAWSYIRAHEPSINGLEKFMDFGFLNSILRTTWQPAVDMWFPPFPINYYYFGHLTTAILTKLSFLPSSITYNLMIATIFSFTFSLSFSLGINFISKINVTRKSFSGGILTGLLVSLGGNLHTIYAFFKPYNVDSPIPFWNLVFSPSFFPNSYWYPNATRFIPFTIHEFPIYSFVVSDLHGHVVDIIYVLTGIALIYILFINKEINKIFLILIALFLAIMYMTNAWDGLIYFMLTSAVIFLKNSKKLKVIHVPFRKIKNIKVFLYDSFKYILSLVILFILFSLPFSLNFKPFASGIGVLCAPEFLVKMGRLGPFLFEANHCQKTPFWQFLILYGFFYFFVLSFINFLIWEKKRIKIQKEDLFVLLLIFISSLLILIPEIVYIKDIYPAHYRANTMFKLVYQAFMMLSLSSAYIIFRIVSISKHRILKIFNFYFVFFIFTILFLIFVFIYPYFAIKSYYAELKKYEGLDGLTYMKQRLPQDYNAINWINKNIKGRPVIVEAQGDSYTDYGRISANTGLPTVLGWTVHEWLWRGTYEIPAPRIEEVKQIYELEDIPSTQSLLKKYKVEYIYVGNLEREKYPNIFEEKLKKIGRIVFEEENTIIYKVNPVNRVNSGIN